VKAARASLLAIFLTACVSHRALVPVADDLTGLYTAEHVVDTVEELRLLAGAKFTFHFWVVAREEEWYEGRWLRRGDSVILIAKDKSGRDVEFPLLIERTSESVALIYSHESYAAAPAKMLLPNSFRRRAETPNQASEPTTLLVTPRAGARVAPSRVVAHL
jgi:hypothetical protein